MKSSLVYHCFIKMCSSFKIFEEKTIEWRDRVPRKDVKVLCFKATKSTQTSLHGNFIRVNSVWSLVKYKSIFEADFSGVEKDITPLRLWKLRRPGGLTKICKENDFTKPIELYDWMRQTFGYKKVCAIRFRNARAFERIETIEHVGGSVQWFYYK